MSNRLLVAPRDSHRIRETSPQQGDTPCPYIAGFGVATPGNLSREKELCVALASAAAAGAETARLGASDIGRLMYTPKTPDRTSEVRRLVKALRSAGVIIIASPGYHGSVSGLVKNAVDYVADLRDDRRTYFNGRTVGCMVADGAWQATSTI